MFTLFQQCFDKFFLDPCILNQILQYFCLPFLSNNFSCGDYNKNYIHSTIKQIQQISEAVFYSPLPINEEWFRLYQYCAVLLTYQDLWLGHPYTHLAHYHLQIIVKYSLVIYDEYEQYNFNDLQEKPNGNLYRTWHGSKPLKPLLLFLRPER